ncbi:MAG: GNAT family N-acetyltransferase [Bacteroidota bacterium]
MMDLITTRKANIADLAALSVLFDGYRVFYKKPTDIEGAQQFLKERMENKGSEIFVAVNTQQQLTGFVQLYPLFSSTRMKRLWLLNDLFVDEHYRGQGISVALINAAKALCIQSGSCGMMLETAKSNLVGNNLYHKTSFTLDDEHNYYYWDA